MLHTGKDHEEYRNVELFVDGWKLNSVEDVDTESDTREDTLTERMEISHINSEKYLGQIVSADGKISKNIEKMRNKGIGLKNKVIQMLESMPGGKYHFVIAKIFRHSYILSSILSSSEVWYGTIQAELDKLEQVDEMWIREVMDCSSSVPKDLLYLELSILPIRYVIQIRRFLYFQHILKQKEDSLLYRFFMAQLTNPTHRDWVSQVLQELEETNIKIPHTGDKASLDRCG